MTEKPKQTNYGLLHGPTINRDRFLELYKKHELVHVKSLTEPSIEVDLLNHLRTLHSKFPAELEETFNFESLWGGDPASASGPSRMLPKPEDLSAFLGFSSGYPSCFYISVIVQDNTELLDLFFDPLPFRDPVELGLFHDNCVWFFLGQAKECNGQGRAEHRDFIASDGSWHVQLRSTKVWHVRRRAEEESIAIAVEPGDMIFINTREWLHRTVLQRNDIALNVSYARDFWIEEKAMQIAQAGGERAGKTNLENPWAKGRVKAGETVYTEAARFIVHDVDALAMSVFCHECGQPVVDLATEKRVADGEMSRFELVQTGLRTSSPLVDPTTRRLFCSKRCFDVTREKPFVSAHCRDGLKNELFYSLLLSGHFELLSMACTAFVQQYRADEGLLQMAEVEEENVNEKKETGTSYVMHETSLEELPFKLSPSLEVVETQTRRVRIGMRVTGFSGVVVESKASLEEFIQEANEQRKDLSANVTGFKEFDWTWTGLELEFDGPVRVDDHEMSRRKWMDSAFALLLKVVDVPTEDIAKEKQRFEKLERLFRFNLRRVASLGLLGFYPTISRIHVGRASEANCRLRFDDAPNRPATVVAIRDIPEGQDFILSMDEDEEEEKPHHRGPEDVQQHSKCEVQPTKRPRLVT